MKLALKIVAVLLGLIILLGAGTYAWASRASGRLLDRTFEVHRVDAPVPFPLSEEARAGLTDEQADSLALAQAVARGRHLVESRYACVECHGKDFGGGVMIDDPAIGTLLGPNLTEGEGSRTIGFTFADFDRIVRHGVRSDGHPAAMPSVDFQRMSDQELSDIIAFIRTYPPVDNEVPQPKLGPIGKVLIATGKLPLSVDLIDDRDAPHLVVPPKAEVSVEFGQHLAGVCTGCHGQDLSGGPIVGGDPSWPPAQDLTPHADALGSWTLNDFQTLLRGGIRPDGTAVREPMSVAIGYASQMTDVELEALWTYLRSIPPVAPHQ